VAKILKPGEGGDLLLLGRSIMSRLKLPRESKSVAQTDPAVP
jgi:hypothetical protein